MQQFKNGKWAKEIVSLQNEDGSWGYFHTRFADSISPITTEQALRRLEALGYTIKDACIYKAVTYMEACLCGTREFPDRKENLRDWDLFVSLILAAWIRRFTEENQYANEIASKWAKIVTYAFEDGAYNHDKYAKAFCDIWKMQPKGGRLIDFVQYYLVSLINGFLDEKTEALVIDYILHKPNGIYYCYDSCLSVVPDAFQSKHANRYIGAIELLAEYKHGKKQLRFVIEWLHANRNENGKWDMGKESKDHIHFPLSDDWRKQATREADSTYRINKLIKTLTED